MANWQYEVQPPLFYSIVEGADLNFNGNNQAQMDDLDNPDTRVSYFTCLYQLDGTYKLVYSWIPNKLGDKMKIMPRNIPSGIAIYPDDNNDLFQIRAGDAIGPAVKGVAETGTNFIYSQSIKLTVIPAAMSTGKRYWIVNQYQ